MHWFRYIALCFVLFEVHTVRGDFGISPVISGATIVEQYARRIRDEANGVVSAYEDIALEGPWPPFNDAAAALKAMFEQIVVFIQPIAQSIGTLALNDVGPAENLFGDADTKINAMSTFISGSAQTQLAAIQTKTYVKPSMVVLVQTKTLQLATDVPAATFSAIESARTINQANVFIQTGLTVASGTTLSELWESEMLKDYEKIINFLQRLKTLVGTEIPLVNGRIAQFAQAFSPLTTPLLSKYSEIDTVYGKITSGTGDNVLNAYKTLVSSAIGYVHDLLDNFYPPIDPAIKRLSEVLVQRGQYSDFCYETYYPKVEQYLFSGEMSLLTCLNAELEREKNLMEAIEEVIYEMQFFLEDTNAHLKTCYRISLFDTPLANQCLQEHSEFSELIPCTAIKEYATMLQLLCKEVDSLRFRLWACVSRDTARFPLEAKDILANIEKCQQFGPQ
uniref:Protein TsetseEP domain-containing protein n=1 Tax=Anopheles maculatus TaxID=74869 RepID=A0A182T165_9DIPT